MSAGRDSVPVEFVAKLASALEGIASQAHTAAEIDNASVLDLLVRHLRYVAKEAAAHKPIGQQGLTVADWRLALLRRTVGRTNGVTLNDGQLGFHIRGLAVNRDTPAVSVDNLLTDLAVLAVDERLKAEAARVDGIVQERVDSAQRVAEAQATHATLERRALEAEHLADELQARASRLAAELAAERRKVEFLRGFVPDDVAGELDQDDGKPASDAKRRVERGIYARTRADGSEAFQVVANASRQGATFGSLEEAVAYRDGAGVAA